jgi:arylsulfatase A-like enzyme
MAAGGVKCTMSYVTNPPCSPSRCSLLTGMYAQRFGKSGMARGLRIPEDHPTLAEFMRDAGYVTGQIGKWDVGDRTQGPQKRGFMEVARWAPGLHYDCTRKDGSPVCRTQLDGEYMAEFVTRNQDKPFFLYFSPLAIHSPLRNTPRRFRDRVRGGRGTAYEGALVAVDDAVSGLLKALRAHGLEKDTLVLLTGDNGPNLREGGSPAPYRGGKLPGNTQYEGWVHTPTIAYWPGVLPAGTVYDGLMCTFDFYATAAALAGRPLPARCDGRDLLPYLKGEKKGDVHEFLFWHNADPTDRPHRNLYAVRWKHWRLVKRKGKWCLYDLRSDPKERKSVHGRHRDVVATMRTAYDGFVAKLPPLIRSKKVLRMKPKANAREGWGWIIGDGRRSGR